ncbi:large ribosomal subunit protein mL52 [Magallana gigas]|uniref:large ribosomal subunit protein mL52 n=1 Tax=Magallana gigas TaxID=29159 RepID=UPI0033426B98
MKYIRNIVPLSVCLFSGTACFLCEILTMSNGCKIKLLLGLCSRRSVSTTPCAFKYNDRFTKYKREIGRGFGAKWRMANGKSHDNTSYGPLIDLPDFSYLDGRPAPLTQRQMGRLEERKQTAKKVYTLLGEIEYAKERHRKLSEEKQHEKPFPLKPKS